MTPEQFQQFWLQLKAPLKVEWEKITDSDIDEIQGNLATFTNVIQKRYGEAKKDEVRVWPTVGMRTGAGNIPVTKILPWKPLNLVLPRHRVFGTYHLPVV